MSKRERVLLYAGLLVGGFLIFQVSRQYEALAETYSRLRERLQWPHAGYSVPTFETVTIDGDLVTLGETAGKRQLVFFFSTECQYCRASLPGWREVIGEARRAVPDIEILGVGADEDEPMAEYRSEHGLQFPVLTFPDPKLKRLYRAGSVPLIAVLDSTGRVLYSRLGALEERAAVDSVLTAVRLAGVEEVEEEGSEAPGSGQ